MTYVEWLRVRGVLKWTAIVFAILLVLLTIVRFVVMNVGMRDAMSWVHGMETGAGSHVTRMTLADGTKRILIDDPKDDTHVVIDDHGYYGKHIEVLDRSARNSRSTQPTIAFGSIRVQTLPANQGTLTVIDTDHPEHFTMFASIATLVALIIATILGAPFARENDGHLEVALTKPIPRERLALLMLGVDAVGILAAWVMTILFLVVAHSLFQEPHLLFDASDATILTHGLLGAFAWYALLCAATSSMKRAYGVVLGLAWPVALAIGVLAHLDLSATTIGTLVHQIVTPLAYIDPLFYLHFGPPIMVNGSPAGALAAVVPWRELPAFLILIIVYCALAIVEWRRVEA